ncbi:hypothetical protein GCM10010254_21980 [Streptomyces chromofuscus]|nr:hypothetical protein GCM10010254_21980 [Streptomyces chromofuscus]
MTGADMRRPIVVGLARDLSKRPALTRAADGMKSRDLPLPPVHTGSELAGAHRSGEARPSWEEWNRALHGLGDQVLEEAVASSSPGARPWRRRRCRREQRRHGSWATRHQGAALVVAGSRHHSRWRELSSASVALHSPPTLPARSRSYRSRNT